MPAAPGLPLTAVAWALRCEVSRVEIRATMTQLSDLLNLEGLTASYCADHQALALANTLSATGCQVCPLCQCY